MHTKIVWEGDTSYGHYQIADTLYDGRPARVLYSGNRRAAQSGMATDDKPELLFDYNQRLFEIASYIQPKRVLIIGGAVGTFATALLHTFPDVRVDMVEPDEKLSELAFEYFGLPVDDRVHIFHTDGRSFLHTSTKRYDFIVIDAFMHTDIPKSIQTLEAFKAYAKHLQSDGVLAMNIISGYYGPSAQVLARIYAATLASFDTLDIFLAGYGYSLWLPQNFVLTAQKGTGRPLKDYVRYETVAPPEVHPGIAVRD